MIDWRRGELGRGIVKGRPSGSVRGTSTRTKSSNSFSLGDGGAGRSLVYSSSSVAADEDDSEVSSDMASASSARGGRPPLSRKAS